MDIGIDILLNQYNISTGDISKGPFAFDCSSHVAIVALVDGDCVWLFPASSQEHTHDLFVLRDSQAVIDLTPNMQSLFSLSLQQTSFVYCGKKNLVTSSRKFIVEGLHNKSIFKQGEAGNDFMSQIFSAVSASRTLSTREKEKILNAMPKQD
ncbi:MAG: hypothetical protein JEY71_04525 [Sphaerochaeta sp.]|nr:hypothetical protein [Sphaerochaeta sp.]